MNVNKLIIALAIFLLTAGVCSADNYVGGIPLTTVKEGVVSGGVFSTATMESLVRLIIIP